MTLVTKPAPEFVGQACMPDGSFKEVKLSDFKGKYVVLFFYPLDFTFVCPSEILAFNDAIKEFESKNVQVLGCSTDSHFTHLAWTKTPLAQGGVGQISFPLIADLSHSMSKSYGVFIDMGISLRGLFVIDRDGVVRHELVNDLPLGRSVGECLRIVDALQHHEKFGEVCPANWKKGAKAMKASIEGTAEWLVEQAAVKNTSVVNA